MKTMISKTVLLGGLIVLAGVAFLLSNLGIIPGDWSQVVISWQMLLILLGVIGLTRRNSSSVGGVIMILVGVIFLLPQLSDLLGFPYSPATLHAVIWPTVVIIVGLLIMFNRHHSHGHHREYGRKNTTTSNSNDGKVDYNLVMNGIDEVFLEPVFRGGEISSMMGGGKLDLRRTALPEGDTILKVSSVFGGFTLFIPVEWNVVIKSDSFLGGMTDHRHGNGACTDRRLIIEANFIFGGGTIE